MVKPAKKGQDWRVSKGKELLYKDLQEGRIPAVGSRGDAVAIYQSRPEFGGDDADERRKFTDRLRRARIGYLKNVSLAKSDSEALIHDRLIHPERQTNDRNERRWDGSEAQSLLRQDVRESIHKNMKPNELHRSREEYGQFPLPQFRQHIYQEEQTQKFIQYRYGRGFG